jgi:hypothetical protein
MHNAAVNDNPMLSSSSVDGLESFQHLTGKARKLAKQKLKKDLYASKIVDSIQQAGASDSSLDVQTSKIFGALDNMQIINQDQPFQPQSASDLNNQSSNVEHRTNAPSTSQKYVASTLTNINDW